MINNAHLKPWLYSKYFVKNYPVRCFWNSLAKFSNKGDEPVEQAPSSSLTSPPKDFQRELLRETYCPPLTQPLPLRHPIKKSLDFLGITGRNDPKTHNNMYFPRYCDIVIIGGGIMGCSIAYWLKQRGHDNGLRVIVVERDPSYTRVYSFNIFSYLSLVNCFLFSFTRLPQCYLWGVYDNNFLSQKTYKCLCMEQSF